MGYERLGGHFFAGGPFPATRRKGGSVFDPKAGRTKTPRPAEEAGQAGDHGGRHREGRIGHCDHTNAAFAFLQEFVDSAPFYEKSRGAPQALSNRSIGRPSADGAGDKGCGGRDWRCRARSRPRPRPGHRSGPTEGPKTIATARVDRLFGVTMAERGVSQIVSVELADAEWMPEAIRDRRERCLLTRA